MDKREYRGSVVGPVILITLGVVFLLNNLNLLSWSVWEVILRLWPVLLIAAGLDVLIGRRSCLGSLLVLIVVVALIAGGLWLALSPAITSQPFSGEPVTQSLDGARQAEVTISPAVSVLRLGALADSAKLVEGTISVAGSEQAVRDFRLAGDTASFTLKSQGVRQFFGWWEPGRTWDLSLNSDVPLRLKTNNGMGESILDLARLNLTALDANMGIGSMTVNLPARGKLQAKLNAGIGEVIVNLPQGMAARLHVRTGIGSSRVWGEQRLGSVSITTPGYETAENRVDLEVSCGIGSVVVQQQ